MIEIVEEKKWYDNSPFIGHCWMTPVYMVKDGEKHFMFNKREPDEPHNVERAESQIEQLKENGGMYFTFHSPMPMKNLLEMFARRQLSFDNYCSGTKTLEYYDDMKCWDFAGNAKEVSASFHFRIYDRHLAAEIQGIVRMIKEKKFELALRKIGEESPNLAKASGSVYEEQDI